MEINQQWKMSSRRLTFVAVETNWMLDEAETGAVI